MHLSNLTDVYQYPGPFATAYFAPGSADQSSGKRMELRWRGLAEQLESAGADVTTCTALADRVAAEAPGTTEAEGRVLVATEGTIVHTEELRGPVGGDHARWARLPDLGATVRANVDVSRQLVAVVNKEGADVRVRDVHRTSHTRVTGRDHPLHQVRGAGWSQRRVQSRVDETVEHNAALVADEIERLARRVRPSTIVLSGEAEVREKVHRHLGSGLRPHVRFTHQGGRSAVDNEHLEATVERLAHETEERRRAELLERWVAGLGKGTAVAGLPEVFSALRQGAVDVLLFGIQNPDAGTPPPGATTDVAIGPGALELARTADELQDIVTRGDGLAARTDTGIGVQIWYDLADAAIIRAGVATSAEVEVVDATEIELADGIGALLRFPIPAAG